MRVALAQVNPVVGDLKGNAELVVTRCGEARAAGAELVVFPELVICGYPPEDLILKDHFVVDCRRALEGAAREIGAGLVAVVGAPLAEGGCVYNAAAVVAGGALAGWYRKILLPNYSVFDEKRYFTSGDRVLVLDIAGAKVGVTVCEDIWFSPGPAETASLSGGASIVLNLSMSPYHVGKGREREAMLSARARAAKAYICYVNGVGGQDELVFDGQSMVFDPAGELVARGRQFEEDLLLVDIDQGGASEEEWPRDRWPVDVIRLDRPRAATSGAGEAPRPPEPAATSNPPVRTTALTQPLSMEAEVYRALCLGARDYALKNGFKQVVMGISGGIDSAVTACVAVDALGAERVNAVSMPSRYSSMGTRTDARETAEHLGARYYEISIESLYESYLRELSAYLDSNLPGLTEQNIQARIRGNLLMALSNRFGWLVLTTGNKSETAVGYATLYGDMAGGFAVLKDVPKTLVYRLADYRNSLGPGAGPIPASTVQRAPSAELAADQMDQDTLPPYDILDRVIEAYVVNDESVDEIASLGMDKALVERVVAMIDHNEYKRRQAAPGVRITPKAFGKDRRLPITNRYRG